MYLGVCVVNIEEPAIQKILSISHNQHIFKYDFQWEF